ncbi:Mpo1-like protein [Thalassotalea maritima]|uniref:Mpo1-like protein n=1 Tax=Thalassotalea maritima TaxID=3242416 RepID=UPI003528C249
MTQKRYTSFKEFYPFYLSQHQHPRCRALHLIGSALVIVLFLYAVLTGQYRLLWLLPIVGYGFAWLGHAVFEKNKPATFTYPLYSFMGDWVMFYQEIRRRLTP